MSILADTFATLGTLLVAYAALRVHHRVLHEHQMDNKVFRTMRTEQGLGILGAILIVGGYIMRLFAA